MRKLRITLATTLIAVLALIMTVWSLPAGATGSSGTTLSATKTATAHLTKTFHWTIDKSVTPGTLDLFRGDQGTSEYTIKVTKDEGTLEAYVTGEITVTNGGAVATENLTIVDNLTMPPSQEVIASVIVDTSANPVLDAGETGIYPYRVNIPAGSVVPGATYKDTADITITNHSGHLGTPFGPNPSATSVLPASPTLVNDSINVDDTNGSSWTFNKSDSANYTKTFTCDNEGTNDNTATIRETGQSDSASVTVNCYELAVTKDASTSLTRTWSWTIGKSADQKALTLALGEQFLVNYTVSVNATPADSSWAVSGKITVTNPAPMDATINGVSDIVSPAISANVNCDVTFPYTLAAGGTLNCTYTAALPDAADRTNTATATLQNYTYDKDDNGTPNGTTEFSGSANVSFANATITEVDESIVVGDTLAGPLGGVNNKDSLPKTFTYSRTIGAYATCGAYTVDNTASFETNDTQTTGSTSWTVNVNVPCAGGCTLTQGYWKTHSLHGPAPYDDTWAQLPNGADTPFYLSGKTYYEVLWTAPAGNAYYNLAHQYIAAKLNMLNGASSTPAVDAAIGWAESFFLANTPDASLSKTARKQVIDNASLLDQYNNGLIGPGHCSE